MDIYKVSVLESPLDTSYSVFREDERITTTISGKIQVVIKTEGWEEGLSVIGKNVTITKHAKEENLVVSVSIKSIYNETTKTTTTVLERWDCDVSKSEMVNSIKEQGNRQSAGITHQ